MATERVTSFRAHRVWCQLWWGDVPRCDCGELDVVDLVEWWVAQARRPRARTTSMSGSTNT